MSINIIDVDIERVIGSKIMDVLIGIRVGKLGNANKMATN